MFSLEIETGADDRDLLIADLWEQGSCGIVEPEGHVVRAFFEDSADRAALLARYPGSAIRIEEDRDWVQASRDLLQPMEVGRRFFLVPEWRDDPAPPGRYRIAVNPGMAFGTGVHETTRLCIEALEEFLAPGMAVLDVGTGSGILRQAAALLGAGKTYACDTDPIAVEIAGNAFIGSVDAVRSGSIDLAVANISPDAIVALAPELLRAVRPDGILVVSGFATHEIDTIREVLPTPTEIRIKREWALIAIPRKCSGTSRA
jgi:ribosomal protein L11 methyltransferase